MIEARERIAQLLAECQRSRETLEQKVEQLESLMDSAPVIICRADLATRVTYVNKKFEEVTGYTRGDVLGRPWVTLGILSRENVRLLTRRMAEKLKGSPPIPTELQIRRKDGRFIWVTGIGEVMRERGRPVGFQVIAQDITERKLYQQKIERAAQEWRATFDAIADWVFIVDRHFRITRSNKAFADAFGMRPEEIIGKTCYELVHGTREPFPDCPHRRAFDAGKLSKSEFFEPKLGIHVEVSCSPLLDESGAATRSVHIVRDITQHRAMERALRESEKRYRLVTENAADVIWTVDLNMRPTYISPSIVRLLGYSVEEAMAKPMEEVFAPASYELAMKALAEELANEKKQGVDPQRSRVLDVELKRKDSSTVPVELKCTFLRDAEGQPIEVLVIARDVAERKRMEEALRASEETYRSFFETARDCAFITTPEGRWVDCNQAAVEFYGYESKEELLKVRVPDLYQNPEDRKKHTQLIDKRGYLEDYAVNLRKKDGTIINALITSVVRKDKEGKVLAYQGTIKDITERKRMEEELKQVKDFLQLQIDRMPIGLIVWDTAFRVQSWNPSAERIFGYRADEALGKHPYDIIVPRQAQPHVDQIWRRLLEGDETAHSVNENTRKDGSIIICEWTNTPLKRQDGTTIGVLSMVQDITERKRAEEELRESAELHSALVELGGRLGEAIIMRQDTEQLEGKHVFVSDAWCQMTGYSAEELLNMSFFELVHPKYREESLTRYRRRMCGEVIPDLIELYIIRKDGTEFPVELTSAYTTYKARPAVVAFIRDITERKKMQEQLMVTDRLASIGELAAGIAHELNNPLTSVIGFSELVLQQDVPADLREDLEVVNREAKRTAEVIRNLLTFAQRHETKKQAVNINHIIKKVLELRAYEQKVHNIEVRAYLAPDLPEITGDPFRLQQVFINIIINAEHFMSEAHGRGTLIITSERQGNFVRATFADDGPGIAPENLRHIFDPFFTTKEVGKGTGLGLSICHGIVTEHGGRIWAESVLGKGATFIMELPVRAKGRRSKGQ
ncbi:MAG TPA: PAS domain S-box protein [Dehalococcoidia bacterium]|nr:PAS domain S-box protein [Dehalococcoidia bacterium]